MIKPLKNYNCFECDGFNNKCPTYKTHIGDLCLYRDIANNDLIKLKLGKLEEVTLYDMLNKFLRKEK